jgi:hypothetical protein
MDPTPFFRPVIAEVNRSVEAFVAANTGTTVEEIDSADELVRIVALAIERRVKEVIRDKGLIDTGTLRASITALPNVDVGALPNADDIGFDDGGNAIDYGTQARANIEI